jgi:flagellar biosynthesis component FlhA
MKARMTVAAALLVTRAADEASLGKQISSQITGYPRAIFVVAGILLFFAIIQTPNTQGSGVLKILPASSV